MYPHDIMSGLRRLYRRVRQKNGKKKSGVSSIADVDIENVFPGMYEHTIEMRYIPPSFGDLSNERALICLLCLEKHICAKKVFEFGTFKGRTTINLALNLPDDLDAKVYSIDLPDVFSSDVPVDPTEEGYMAISGSRKNLFDTKILDDHRRQRIVLIKADSRIYDFKQYHGEIDIVFVDGGHSYETVYCDSVNALKIVKPGGYIVWDDYMKCWPGVRDLLDSLSRQVMLFRDIKTGFVFHHRNDLCEGDLVMSSIDTIAKFCSPRARAERVLRKRFSCLNRIS